MVTCLRHDRLCIVEEWLVFVEGAKALVGGECLEKGKMLTFPFLKSLLDPKTF